MFDNFQPCLMPQDWITSVAGKQAAFHGIAEYYQSLVSKEAKDFGEEIARLRVCILDLNATFQSEFLLFVAVLYL